MTACRECPPDGICPDCASKELRYRPEEGADALQLQREEARTSLAFRLTPWPRTEGPRTRRARAQEKTWPLRPNQD